MRPARAPSAKKPRAMPMVIKLAYRNLFHDRLSLTVTLVGIVFSVVLVAVQFGI
jgi:putative ABC transport system permease protein